MNICLYFQVHQPYRLAAYRFFDIGDHDRYFDEYANRFILQQVAEKCYLPANEVLMELIERYGDDFKVAFSISGMALEQFKAFEPKVIESFQKLANTGSVEFLAETWAHSLASLKSKKEFEAQVSMHEQAIWDLFGQKTVSFRNTELIFSNDIAKMVNDMGYKTMLTEGAKHILGWRSPNKLYTSAEVPALRLLLKNFRLSDDIAFRFSNRDWKEWPLTAEKYVSWLQQVSSDDDVINLFMDYEPSANTSGRKQGFLISWRPSRAWPLSKPGCALKRRESWQMS